MAVPTIVRANTLPELIKHLQRVTSFLDSYISGGELHVPTSGKGTVLINAAGTVTKRVRLNDAGDGLIYEDI